MSYPISKPSVFNYQSHSFNTLLYTPLLHPQLSENQTRHSFNFVVSGNLWTADDWKCTSSVMKVHLSYFPPQIPKKIGLGQEIGEMWNPLQL
uniref:Uncharacterized protein n=1 Tax=Lepeophtheirus salmonis TaxID=72036 RepID=A0A0K2UFU6_LEPSM